MDRSTGASLEMATSSTHSSLLFPSHFHHKVHRVRRFNSYRRSGKRARLQPRPTTTTTSTTTTVTSPPASTSTTSETSASSAASMSRRHVPTLSADSAVISTATGDSSNVSTDSSAVQTRARRTTALSTQSDIHDAILHPGNVRINVRGAFIVDDTNSEPSTPRSEDYEHDPHEIRLPHHTEVVSHIAVDIGGSLAKLVYFTREPNSTSDGGRLNFVKFETDRIDSCIDFMRKLQADYQRNNGSKPEELCVMATGGGAFKYYDRIREALNVEVIREEEMECLIIGLDFFITEIPKEVFTYSEDSPMEFMDLPSQPPSIYPYLLVNIGSGVSMIKVSGPRQFERIGGTSLGGGTLWGLLSLLTGARNFDDMLKLAAKGDNSTVDLLVGDIYGGAYNKIGLKSTHIASSFGKVYKQKRVAEQEAEDGCNGPLKTHTPEQELVSGTSELPHPSSMFRPEDISRSLLYAVSNNIGQIAYLHAEKHNLPHIYFGGSFIGGHAQTMNTLSYAIRFWSKGSKQAYFLRHEGYLGSVGAFLKRQPRNWGRRNSFETGEKMRV